MDWPVEVVRLIQEKIGLNGMEMINPQRMVVIPVVKTRALSVERSRPYRMTACPIETDTIG